MKICKIGAILLLVCMFSGCIFVTSEPYEFRQAFDQIMSIEILKKEYDTASIDDPMNFIYTVDPSLHRSFIDDLIKIEGGRMGLDPTTGFGVYIIRITYKDGEMEMIGNYSNGYITPDGIVHEDVYMFKREQYYAFLSDVLGVKITDYLYG